MLKGDSPSAKLNINEHYLIYEKCHLHEIHQVGIFPDVHYIHALADILYYM